MDINVLHRRFDHISYDRIKTMVRNGQLRGIDSLSGKPEFCEPCVLGKMRSAGRRTSRLTFVNALVSCPCQTTGSSFSDPTMAASSSATTSANGSAHSALHTRPWHPTDQRVMRKACARAQGSCAAVFWVLRANH
ncbi:hypothetical protein AURDEDRAFT_59462 [Auricularia subglabra TFB-10046 SS5]|nr:hypothetical protein AURDEDRAFT_59462 [Auricularia subglabra TFB-10046 SS5]